MFRGESKPLVSKPQGRSPLSIFSCLAPGQRGGPPSPSALPTSLPSRLPQLRGCACRQAMQLLTLGEKEVGMLSWLPRRRARIGSIEAEAEALVRDLGEAAYNAARRREHEASSDEIARDWGFVALAVARLIGERNDVDPLVRLPMNAALVPDREVAEELARVIAATPHPFRIQFVGARGGTDNYDGSRDSGGRCVGSHRRRRESRLAASNDRIAHSRRPRSRSLCATEGRSPSRGHDEETRNRVFLDALEKLIDVTERVE